MSLLGRPNGIWQDWSAAAERLDRRFAGLYQLRSFDYRQPLRLQQGVPRRLQRPYTTPVAYADWGPRDAPILICCGGVANTARRFSFLAADLSRHPAGAWRVIAPDWLGRGQSGWLADECEYTRDTYVEQLRQLIAHLGGGPVALLGSSMGGSVGIELAARDPSLVSRLILNDVGPHIPRARRLKRANTLARHYVFRSPADIMRRVGAAHKNDGPVPDDIRLFLAWHQTRWSDENAGRVYRLDPRALQAYRADAQQAVDQWQAWRQLSCPLLVLHGMQSDALLAPTLRRMQKMQDLTLVHIPQTGHTPVLFDRNQTQLLGHWLVDDGREPVELSLPLAWPRQPW
ncbi:MAG: alpha/beta hydrolase [Burkholderiaceae bacterium]|nr:alpha/beta hydrolase [Burkholderiaceae bacterium]